MFFDITFDHCLSSPSLDGVQLSEIIKSFFKRPYYRTGKHGNKEPEECEFMDLHITSFTSAKTT